MGNSTSKQRDMEPRSSDSSTIRQSRGKDQSGASYIRFIVTIGTSTALMFGLMYLNSYSVEHLYWSETRFYMTFVMGATMAVVMLAFMLGMYRNMLANAAIVGVSVLMFGGALWLVRSQETIQDESWMSAMIPHHSIAIMTSERAEITDPRVSKLASEIVTAQNREISEMRFLLNDINANGEAGPEWPLGEHEGPLEVQGLREAVATPVIAGIRPAPLNSEDVDRALESTAQCSFIRAVNAAPILVTDGSGNGVAKISGALVKFTASETVRSGGILIADGGRLTLSPGNLDVEDATLFFELLGEEQQLAVGFTGYWNCNS